MEIADTIAPRHRIRCPLLQLSKIRCPVLQASSVHTQESPQMTLGLASPFCFVLYFDIDFDKVSLKCSQSLWEESVSYPRRSNQVASHDGRGNWCSISRPWSVISGIWLYNSSDRTRSPEDLSSIEDSK